MDRLPQVRVVSASTLCKVRRVNGILKSLPPNPRAPPSTALAAALKPAGVSAAVGQFFSVPPPRPRLCPRPPHRNRVQPILPHAAITRGSDPNHPKALT